MASRIKPGAEKSKAQFSTALPMALVYSCSCTDGFYKDIQSYLDYYKKKTGKKITPGKIINKFILNRLEVKYFHEAFSKKDKNGEYFYPELRSLKKKLVQEVLESAAIDPSEFSRLQREELLKIKNKIIKEVGEIPDE